MAEDITLLKFNCKPPDDKELRESLLKIPAVHIAPFDKKARRRLETRIGRKSLVGAVFKYRGGSKTIRVSKKHTKNVKRGWNNSEVFGNMIKKTRLPNFCKKAVLKEFPSVLMSYLRSDGEGEATRHLRNGCVAIIKRGVITLALKHKGKLSAVTKLQKGHGLYYIATGQMYKSLKGIVEKQK